MVGLNHGLKTTKFLLFLHFPHSPLNPPSTYVSSPFHMGTLGLWDPSLICAFRNYLTLLTVFTLPSTVQYQQHQAIVEISLFLLKFCGRTRPDLILYSVYWVQSPIFNSNSRRGCRERWCGSEWYSLSQHYPLHKLSERNYGCIFHYFSLLNLFKTAQRDGNQNCRLHCIYCCIPQQRQCQLCVYKMYVKKQECESTAMLAALWGCT